MPRFRPQVSIIGLGSIGGSLGLSLSSRGIRVTGFDSSPAAVSKALRKGAICRGAVSLAEAATGSDIVVVCVPVDKLVECIKACLKHAKNGAIVTDVGSVKGEIVRKAGVRNGGAEYLGGHPMAGTEKSGFDSACAGMFRGRVCILTPVRSNSKRAVAVLRKMWSLAGAKTMILSPARHDSIVSKISHLPHAIAVALVETGRREKDGLKIASGSFRDATRVAESEPLMWESIFRKNAANLSRSISEFIGRLAEIGLAVRARRGGRLLRMLERASSTRRAMGRKG